jgi:hypothetical protein
MTSLVLMFNNRTEGRKAGRNNDSAREDQWAAEALGRPTAQERFESSRRNGGRVGVAEKKALRA